MGEVSQKAELSPFCVELPQPITAEDKLRVNLEVTLRNAAIDTKEARPQFSVACVGNISVFQPSINYLYLNCIIREDYGCFNKCREGDSRYLCDLINYPY